MGEQKKPTNPATERWPADGTGRVQRSGAPRGTAQREAVATTNPFTLMRRMFDDMDRMFEGLGGGAAQSKAPELWSPPIEVFERDNRLVVRADLPGIAPEDVNVHVDEDGLHLEGERRHEEEREKDGVFETERSYGSFQRRIPLPRHVDVSQEKVSFQNGVLEISFGLKTSGRRAISVGSSAEKPAKPATTTLNSPQQRSGPASSGEAPRH